jgi:alpha-mannosidase
MIGNAHIDPVWLWTAEEGREEVLASYRTAISLIADYEGYLFTSGGAATYQWVQEDDPALFGAIRRAVQAGRWSLVNGWWLQPDCNIPSGESFARHALYGQRYLQRQFGRRARVGYNVDSFGHANTLPQLLKLSGLDEYVFFRPGPHEKSLPDGPFWWEAPGGARVLTCRPPLHYGSPEDADMAARMAAAAAQTPAGMPLVMCFYGVGDHGGGPTRRNVEAILQAARDSGPARPVFSSPERYFDEARALGRAFPVVRDELQHHARGCYSALSRVKRENRHAEHALMAAERWTTLAFVMADGEDPRAPLAQAWQHVLFNQFHDILAGTCIREGYEAVWQGYARARETAAALQGRALDDLTTLLDIPEGEGAATVVWNPLPWARYEVARFDLPLGDWRHDRHGHRYPVAVSIRDATGDDVPCQILDVTFDHNTYVAQVAALADAPALGAAVLRVRLEEGAPPAEAPTLRPATTIENTLYRLGVDPATGWISSLWDRQQQREVLAEPVLRPLVIHDPSDTWSHDAPAFREVVGVFSLTEPPMLLHAGPVCQTLRLRSAWGRSTLEQEIILYRDLPWVDVTCTVDWHEQHKALKMVFPFGLQDAVVTAASPYGWVERRLNGEEEPCQEWIDIHGRAPHGPQGFCLINDSKYGYDALDGELRLTALRSPIYAFHDPREIVPGVSYDYTDQGRQTWRLRLMPHAGPWQDARPIHASYALHEPLVARPAAQRAGKWGGGSLLRIVEGDVAVTVVKLAEDSPTLLVRGYETAGRSARLVLASELLALRWECDIASYEIFTLALPLDGRAARPLDLVEEPLAR